MEAADVARHVPAVARRRNRFGNGAECGAHAVLVPEATATAQAKKPATAAGSANGSASRAGKGTGPRLSAQPMGQPTGQPTGQPAGRPTGQPKPTRPAKRTGPLHNSEVKLFND